MKMVRGFAQLQLIAGVVGLALLLGAVTYHFSIVYGLQKQIKAQQLQIDILQTKLSSLQADNALTVAENKSYKALVDTQNTVIAKMEDTARIRQMAADKAIEAARAQMKVWEGQYKTVLKAGPIDKDDQCVSVEAKLNAYLELRTKERQSEVPSEKSTGLDGIGGSSMLPIPTKGAGDSVRSAGSESTNIGAVQGRPPETTKL